MPVPTEIRLDRAARVLHVTFDDATFALPAEYLRVESPSAEVQGHGAVEPVGHYAVRLTFDDGHDTGIYSWDYLRELGVEQERRWAGYLSALSARGLKR